MCSVSAMTLDGAAKSSYRVSSFTNNSLFLQVDDTLVVQDAPRHLDKLIAAIRCSVFFFEKQWRDWIEERHTQIWINLNNLNGGCAR
jgi:hypothetical protein